MSGQLPFFLTGGNARILLDHKTMAFCTDVSYRVVVRHAAPRVLGRFEVEAIQPLSYEVSGTMTLIRYARGIKSFMGSGAPKDVSEKGDSISSFTTDTIGGNIGRALGLPTADGQFSGAANESLIPGRMFQSKMFDIEIRQKLPKNTNTKFVGISLFSDSITRPANDETTIVLLRNCRIEDSSFSLSKRGVATVTLSFRAQYADDDAAIAVKSGVGQELV